MPPRRDPMCPDAAEPPLISVITPTYRRPALLRRAVQSVLAQTYRHWELLISDDEEPAGETWAIVRDLARHDPRIRPLQNPGPHGQTHNVNFAIRHARGEWLKPLYDDDVLLPDCLARMARSVAGRSGIALVRCLCDRYTDGKLEYRARHGRLPLLQRLKGSDAQLAMYLQDIEIGLPTQVMIHRDAVLAGAWFEEPPELRCGIDTWWYARILQHGDLLLVNRTLAHEHQGSHGTLTGATSDADFDQELIAFRRMLHPLLTQAANALATPPNLPGEVIPPLPTVEQSIYLNRALHRLYRRRPLQALRLACAARRPAAWRLAAHWLLRRTFPGAQMFELVPRIAVNG